jgi:hypothetical protein
MTDQNASVDIAGLRTTYSERERFTKSLQDLFAKIEELNRPAPMTEGEYLEFANLIKGLSEFAKSFTHKENGNPVYIALVAATARPERARPPTREEKLKDDKKFRVCPKCDGVFGKNNWYKHKFSNKCADIFQQKTMAARLTKIEAQKANRFDKTAEHEYFSYALVVNDCLRRQKCKTENTIEELHSYRIGEANYNPHLAEPEPQPEPVVPPSQEGVKRGGGRPKGAKNKPKAKLVVIESDSEDEE